MRQFLFPRHPLPRRTLLFCHAIIQLGLLVAGGLWLAPRTPGSPTPPGWPPGHASPSGAACCCWPWSAFV
nr:hypothetical protein [Halomonas elongata]